MPADLFKRSNKIKTRESLPVAIYNSGIQQCPPGYSWGPGVRDHFLIHHVLSGRGRCTAEGVTHPVEAGDTFLIWPSQLAGYCADEQQPWQYCWVGFSGAQTHLLMNRTPFRREAPVVRLPCPDRVAQAILDLDGAVGSSEAEELRATGYLYLFLALLAEQSGSARREDGALSHGYVENALRYITRNYSHPIDVQQIADSIGVSRSHLYRVFVHHTGLSPNAYLAQFRMRQACELLIGHKMAISEIAASVGYSDPLYFSRVFRKLVGCTPSSYPPPSATLEGE